VEELFLGTEADRLSWRRFVGVDASVELRWSTQRRIEFEGGHYVLDILLEASNGTNLLVVENKIASPLRRHDRGGGESEHAAGDPERPTPELEQRREAERLTHGKAPAARLPVVPDQLHTYGRWLAEHVGPGGWPGAIALLTHACTAPPGFAQGERFDYGVPLQRVCRWFEVWQWLGRLRSRASSGPDIVAHKQPAWAAGATPYVARGSKSKIRPWRATGPARRTSMARWNVFKG
jgi:hypothetical protein